MVGTIGGLGTPFLLYSNQDSPVALVAYTCLILMGTSAIYFRQGWQSLLWTTLIGVGMIFSWVVISTLSLTIVGESRAASPQAITHLELTGIQLGFGIGWVAFALVPIARVLAQLRQARGSASSVKIADGVLLTVGAIAFLSPIGFLLATGVIWRLDQQFLGWITVGVAALYWVGGYVLRQRRLLKPLGSIHWLAAIVLFSLALPTIVHGNLLLAAVALEGFLVHFVSRRTSASLLLIPAHLLGATTSIWLLQRFCTAVDTPIVLNAKALTDLAAMGLLLGASLTMRAKQVSRLYQLVLHIGVLMWLWRELSALGVGYVTIAWGIYAIGLLIIGLRQDWLMLRQMALATLLLAVLKLLAYDLNNLEAVWRILLFLGFGAVFLGLSYALQDLWKPRTEETEAQGIPEINE